MKFKALSDRHQQSLLPRSLDEYVSVDDSVRFIDALIDELDLTGIESSYSERGCRAYSPSVLVKLLVYGKTRGIRTSRGLSQAVKENVRFMFLAQGQTPDFRTINRFRKDFSEELGEVFVQTVRLGVEQGVVSGETLSVDGTKLRAFASNKSFKTEGTLEKMLEEVELELKQSFKDDIKLDQEEDDEYGDDDGEPKLPASCQKEEVLRAKIRGALKEFDKAKEQNNYKPLKASLTDPESRILRSSDGGSNPSYNAQIAVDTDSGFVVGAVVSNAGSDHGMLFPTVDDAIASTKKIPKTVVADAGYGKHEPLKQLSDEGIDMFVPLPQTINKFTLEDFTYDENTDEYRCPGNRVLTLQQATKRKSWKRSKKKFYVCADCTDCSLRAKCLKFPETMQTRRLTITPFSTFVLAMRAKMRTAKAKEMMALRAQTVEPVFGVLKYAKQLQRFYFRGLKRVHNEWRFELAARNIEKLANINANLAAAA